MYFLWAHVGIGVFILISPWILGFQSITLAKWANALIGTAIILINLWALFADRKIDVKMEKQKTSE